jgi:flagellar biosynthesis/type III secretory pathway protein FliH
VTDSAVQVVGNERLLGGDFRLRTTSGVLEANLGTRLDLLCKVLLEEPQQ